jgi:hypothetical protein
MLRQLSEVAQPIWEQAIGSRSGNFQADFNDPIH